MIELVMSVCALSTPYPCKEVALTFQDVTQFQCLMFGQLEMAKWAEVHPGWHITKWRCGVPGQISKL